MAGAVTFFNPEDVIGLNSYLELTAEDTLFWETQTTSTNQTKERQSGLGNDGDERAHKDHNAIESVTVTYVCFAESGTLLLPNVGLVTGGYHIDSLSVGYSQTGWPTLSVTAHKHTDAETHANDSTRQYKAQLALPAGYCTPTEIKDGESSTTFKLTNVSIGMTSLTYELSCTHVDETGACGNWLAGENHDGVESLNAQFTGNPEAGDLTIDVSWSKSSVGSDASNTAANTANISLVRHIPADVDDEE